jgi:hypothetical protein
MTTELYFIRDEITALNEHWADMQMLQSLANNIVFSLNKLQQAEQHATFLPRQQQKISDTITDVLSTVSKELSWAAELPDTHPEQIIWYRKAKKQLLEDIEKLFEP